MDEYSTSQSLTEVSNKILVRLKFIFVNKYQTAVKICSKRFLSVLSLEKLKQNNMKKLLTLISVFIILIAFSSCDRMDMTSTDQVGFKSTVAYCGPNVFYNTFYSFSGVPGEFTMNGWVLFRNNEVTLNLLMRPASGFQNYPDNIDIGFYTESLPVNSRPDPDALHYHFTTGEATEYTLDFPLNEIFIENLGISKKISCGEELFIVIHYDGIDASGNVYDIWVGNYDFSGYENNNYWWYKYSPYTIACCCVSETAWAYGNRYVPRGNWATYTPYLGVEKSVVLFAGQYFEAGIVYFTPVNGGVNVKIELNDGWELQAITESVKIQGYSVAPTANPAPGSFNTYKGNSLDVTIPMFNFYGIHLDLINCP